TALTGAGSVTFYDETDRVAHSWRDSEPDGGPSLLTRLGARRGSLSLARLTMPASPPTALRSYRCIGVRPSPGGPASPDCLHAALSHRVFGTRASFRGCEAPALGGDGAALNTVRRRHVHGDQAVIPGRASRVHLGRTGPDPQLGHLRRHPVLDADVVRLVVPGPVGRREHGRELVENERSVRRRVLRCPVGPQQGLGGVRFRAHFADTDAALADAHESRQSAADHEAAAEDLTHIPHLMQVSPDETGA